MSIIQIQLIKMTIHSGRTLQEREAADRIRWWCVCTWLQGNLTLPAGALEILLSE